MSITGSSSIRRLEECPVVMGLHELVPVGGRATSGRHRRRFEWFVEVCENLPDRPRLCDERDQPDVAAARWALKRKLLPYPRHELGPRNPRRVVRAGLSMRVTTASCGATVVRMSAGRGVLPLADIPDCQRRDGPPELVVGCKHPVVAMPVLPRRRHEIGEPVEELKRREVDDAIGSRPGERSAAAGPDPVGRFVSREQRADADDAAAGVADHGEPFKRKGWPGAVPQKVFQTSCSSSRISS